jgi:hypothetical protein
MTAWLKGRVFFFSSSILLSVWELLVTTVDPVHRNGRYFLVVQVSSRCENPV